MSTAPSVAIGVELGGRDPLAGDGLGEPVDRVDPDLGDGVGVGLGDASISTPPSADSMPRCFLAERSSVKLA